MGPSIVGIIWLAPIFGIYFAVQLASRGQGPASAWRPVGFAILGVAVLIGRGYLGSALHLNPTFHPRLLFIWSVLALAALVTAPGWPALFSTLLAYAYSARIPVAIIMFFAFRGHWGTHYDAAPPDLPPEMGIWPKYLWLGFFPQLIFWVGFTILVGMLAGAVAAPFLRPVEQIRDLSGSQRHTRKVEL